MCIKNSHNIHVLCEYYIFLGDLPKKKKRLQDFDSTQMGPKVISKTGSPRHFRFFFNTILPTCEQFVVSYYLLKRTI